MTLVNVEDVADLYFAWDDLLARVFDHAYGEKRRLFPSGVSFSTLIGSN
jgi:hypothetical protein